MRMRTLTVTALGALALMAAVPLTAGAATTPSAVVADGGCTITGTPRADRLIGTSRADVICGRGGNDVIIGNGGADTLIGGTGNDRLEGGAGTDRLIGDAGSDTLVGGDGRDTLIGGDGRDTLAGGAQPDQFIGGPGLDRLSAGTAGDTCAVDPVDPVTGACANDTTGPEISDVRLPAELNAGETITVTWRVTDASGIDSPGGLFLGGFGPNTQALFGGPPGFLSWCDFPGEAIRVSGNAQDGVYQSSCDFPATAPNDTYTVILSATDVFGNSLPGFSLNVDFAVVNGSADNDVPVIADVQTDAATYAAGDEVTITLRATDETGVAGIVPWAFGPNGRLVDDNGTLWLDYDLATLTGGDATDGTYSVTLKLSDAAVPGDYNFYFSVRDVVGNRAYFSVEAGFAVA
jgi:hypothetical protein